MSFKSEAQRRFMYSQHPELAKEFEKATPEGADLPEHVKKMADGGEVDKDEPGLQDTTASNFLLPFLLGPRMGSMAEDAGAALKGLGEAGEATIGRAAPAMEEAAPGEVTAYVKGIQKGAPGTEGVKIYGVKGSPEKLKELFGDEAPGSVPESILREKGILPASTVNVPQNAPNAYAEGGRVERSSLAHPVPNSMMARAMNGGGYADGGVVDKIKSDKTAAQKADDIDPVVTPSTDTPKGYADGGYPHVTFLENESPATVNKVTHVEHAPSTPATSTETGEKDNPTHMAEGGKTPHFLEGLKKGALHEEMGVPEGEKIPGKKLEKAANSDNETLRKRAQFAINAKKWHHAEGGEIQKAEGRDAEPPKPKDVDMSHEEKLKSIYRAFGMKKYADGGEVTPTDGTVDVSQLPGGGMGAPNPSDPGFWDEIKAALSKVSAPITGAASAAAAPAKAINSTMAPVVAPAAAGALNSLTGANLPTPTAPAPAAAPAASPAVPPVALPTPPPAMPATAPAIPAGNAPSGMPNLSTIFNQDTSKLTAGVNPEDRQALAAKLQSQQHGLGAIIAQAVSGVGDALAAKGGKEQHSLQNIFSMQKTQRDEALNNFDVARQDRIQKLQLQTQMGDNALKQAAAQDAYGVDENLNKLIGAPVGTMKKDLPTYFSLMSAQVAKQEKDADLYMKAHTQASTDVDNAVKNASVLGIKPSAAQLQASGAKLADMYYNRAKGNVLVHSSDGQQLWMPAASLPKAKQLDPNLQVQP